MAIAITDSRSPAAGTLARLKAVHAQILEPLFAEHRGRVVKLMGDGLLVIDLKRELPEELKPRRIPIGTGKFVSMVPKPGSGHQHIEKSAA